MQITVLNFGGFKGSNHLTFESKTLSNGQGKTSLINAYVFALSGRTLNGFAARNINAAPEEQCTVTLHQFIDLPPIRRVLTYEGTTLYVGDDVVTQTDFVTALKSRSYDLDFVIVCANANVLTSTGLDTATLRKILSKADVLDSDEYDGLKKDISALRAKRKIAEQHALTNVIVPVRLCEALSQAEREFAASFKEDKTIVNDGIVGECPHCQRTYEQETINELSALYNEADERVKKNMPEFVRIMHKSVAYNEETRAIDDAERLLVGATKARKDMIAFDAELKLLNEEIQLLDAESVKAHLPEFVDVITEVPQKNGVMKSTCTLEYQGVPLKSINHAKRIEICVCILDHARTTKGMQRVPIVVDNAEAVEHNFENYENVILFKAMRKE